MTPQQEAALRKLRRQAALGNPHARQALAGLIAQHTPTVLGRADEQRLDEQRLDENAADELEVAAVTEASMPGADSLDVKAALRKTRLGMLNQQAPFVATNPPSVLAGISGNQATVKPGELHQVCFWQGDDAHASTVSLAIAPVQQQATTDQDFVTAPLSLGSGLGNRPYARIQFGTKGFSVAAFVDIGTGVQLDVCASMVTIEVGLKINPNITTPAMQLAGMIGSFKPIMRTAPLLYTLYADDTGVVNTNIYPVPPFAKRVWFIKQSIADVVTLNVVNFAHSPPGNFEYQGVATIAANTQMADAIVLPGDAVAVSATNAAGNAQGRFVFELGL